MTPEELAPILRHLAGHLNHLQGDLRDQPLHAPHYSQTDSHKSHGGPKPPCNTTQLDYLLDLNERLGELCGNIADDLHLMLPHKVKAHGNGMWYAWLLRHASKLPTLTWYPDLTDALVDTEAELRHHIHPPQSNPQYEQRQTSRSIIYRLHQMGHTTITPNTLRQWAHRGKITTITTPGGRNTYLLTEVLSAMD